MLASIDYTGVMAGASEQTMRVTTVNANWTPGEPGSDGSFELMIVTEDGERRSVSLSAAAVTAVGALARSGTVLLWDPAGECLIVANVVGEWLSTDWSAT